MRSGLCLRFLAFLFISQAVTRFPASATESAPAPANAASSSGAAAGANSEGRVSLDKINTNFLQNGGSCVLSSYAIVANYFTGAPLASFFEGYCSHFGLKYTNGAEAEQKYARHFDAEWRKRNCMGYQVILDLHKNSKEKCFVEARKVFNARFYLESAKHLDELEQLLNSREAFLNITYEPGGDYHSITVARGAKGLMSRDTNQKGLHQIPSLRKIGKLRDSVLYIRRDAGS
jgi:hypothetical protein